MELCTKASTWVTNAAVGPRRRWSGLLGQSAGARVEETTSAAAGYAPGPLERASHLPRATRCTAGSARTPRNARQRRTVQPEKSQAFVRLAEAILCRRVEPLPSWR